MSEGGLGSGGRLCAVGGVVLFVMLDCGGRSLPGAGATGGAPSLADAGGDDAGASGGKKGSGGGAVGGGPGSGGAKGGGGADLRATRGGGGGEGGGDSAGAAGGGMQAGDPPDPCGGTCAAGTLCVRGSYGIGPVLMT